MMGSAGVVSNAFQPRQLPIVGSSSKPMSTKVAPPSQEICLSTFTSHVAFVKVTVIMSWHSRSTWKPASGEASGTSAPAAFVAMIFTKVNPAGGVGSVTV